MYFFDFINSVSFPEMFVGVIVCFIFTWFLSETFSITSVKLLQLSFHKLENFLLTFILSLLLLKLNSQIYKLKKKVFLYWSNIFVQQELIHMVQFLLDKSPFLFINLSHYLLNTSYTSITDNRKTIRLVQK